MSLKKKRAPGGELSSTGEFERLLKDARGRGRYVLRLYVSGTTARSGQAIANIRSLCDEYLVENYDLEVVDIYQQPTQAADEQIIAAPTLVKKMPKPTRRMIGDLSNRDRVLIGLDLWPKDPAAPARAHTKWMAL